MAKTHSVAEKMCLLEPTAQIWMKIDPYYQRQKCRAMILVSGNIRFMGIFVGVPLGGGRPMRVGLTMTAIFGDLSGYFFGIFRDNLSSIICWPLAECKRNDLERLYDAKIRFRPTLLQHRCVFWMTLSGYFMTKCVFSQHFLNQSVWMSEIVQHLRFCSVLCIARSVIQPR